MKVWIPDKWEIEDKLQKCRVELIGAKTVSEIKGWLIEELSAIRCDIANRAREEREYEKAD